MFILAWFLLVHLIKACFFILALCIAFAPFAALIAAYIARRRNLPALRYALLGALGAACFIIPWIYLIQRMRNKPISLGTANAAYTILYALWFFVLLGGLYWCDLFGQILKALVDSGYRTLHPNVGWVGNVGGDLGIVSAARRLFAGHEYAAPQ